MANRLQADPASGNYPKPLGDPRPQADEKNTQTVSALALALLAWGLLIASPFKWVAALAAVAAIWFGVLAIRRDHEGTGKRRGVSAILLGAVALPLALVASLPSLGEGFEEGYDSAQSAEPAATSPSAAPAAPTVEVSTPANTLAATSASPGETPSEPVPASNPTEAAAPVTKSPASEYGDYPQAEAALIAGVEDALMKYQAAETDLQESKALSDRDRDLLPSIGGSQVSNWVGVVEDVGANGEGMAYVYIKISDDIQVQTWNNSFSDLYDDTLIPETSPVYDALLSMTPGQKVVFSGSFVGRDDASLYAKNITDTFSARTPEFLFNFSAIAPA